MVKGYKIIKLSDGKLQYAGTPRNKLARALSTSTKGRDFVAGKPISEKAFVSLLTYKQKADKNFEQLRKKIIITNGLDKKSSNVIINPLKGKSAKMTTQITLNQTEQKVFKSVLDVAQKHGLTLRVAGGWVRDKVLGKESHDIDIAVDGKIDGKPVTGAMFAELMAKESGKSFAVIAANPEQSKHLETATMDVHGVSVDFVHLRSETYGDSRIPEVSVGSPEVDAHRRDLTINSLFFNINENKVEDLTGKGVSDLKAGIIRTPLESVKTLKDDPLRALRAIRFAAKFGFKVDESLMEAMQSDDVRQAFADKIAVERMSSELDGIMKFNPVLGTRLLVETGLLDNVVPELAKMDFDQKTKWHDKTVLDHTLALAEELHNKFPDDVDLKWAAILHDIGKPGSATVHKDGQSLTFIGHEKLSAKMTEDILNRLRFSKDRIKNIRRLVDKHMITFSPSWNDFKLKKWIREHFADASELKRLIALRGADINALNPEHNQEPKTQHQALAERVSKMDVDHIIKMDSFIDGVELQKIFGRKAGAWIKEVKSKMIDLQLQGLVNSREEAIERAQKWAEREAEGSK